VKALVCILTALAIITGCNRKAAVVQTIAVKDSTSIQSDTKYIFEDKAGTPDSAIINALLHCDSLGNIYISTIAQLQGKILTQEVSMQGNNLTVKAKSATRETRESFTRDSIITVYRDLPLPYPVETITNKLTSWQSYQIWTGRIALLLILIWVVIQLAKNKFQVITKLFKKQ
jgi:hypothetical protein